MNQVKYTQEQLNIVKTELEELLYYFGYVKEEDNQFGFFDFEGKASQKSKDRYYGFKKANEKTMEWVLSKDYDPSKIQLPINVGDAGIKILSEKKHLFDIVTIQSSATMKETKGE